MFFFSYLLVSVQFGVRLLGRNGMGVYILTAVCYSLIPDQTIDGLYDWAIGNFNFEIFFRILFNGIFLLL